MPGCGLVEADGHEIGGDVGAHVARDQRTAPDARLGVRPHAELVREVGQDRRLALPRDQLELA